MGVIKSRNIKHNKNIFKMDSILYDQQCSQPFITKLYSSSLITLPREDRCLILGMKIKTKHLHLERPRYWDFGRNQPFQISIILLLSMELKKWKAVIQ
jgi:hypothetical protein